MIVYEIRDRQGHLRAYHTRRDTPDGKVMRWRSPDGTTGLNGTPTASLPLYNAHLLDGWRDPIIVAEGEKSAQALVDAGFPAVGTVTGASETPGADVLADLEGRAVILWPDADEPGRKHMTRVADRLVDRAAVGWLDWPDAPEKGDAADALAAGESIADLLATATAYAPEEPAFRTLADIPDDPPEQLLLDMLEPQSATLMYAAPGVGKGTTGAWLACQLLEIGMRPVVYDAERRPREWSRRVAGLGGDRSRVAYINPTDLGPKHAGRPLWEAAEALAPIVRAARGDLLLIDSVLPATGLGEERLRSDASAPFLYVEALDRLGIPSVSFGHPPKGSPEGDPFGSFAWVAASRLTWLGTRCHGDGHTIRWRPRKRNERGHIGGVLLSIAYGDDGRPCTVTRADDEQSTRELLFLLLKDGARSVADLADELLSESDEPATADLRDRTKERLGRTLRRLAREGLVQREGPAGGPGVKWSIKWTP
jgi:hypothetical protein